MKNHCASESKIRIPSIYALRAYQIDFVHQADARRHSKSIGQTKQRDYRTERAKQTIFLHFFVCAERAELLLRICEGHRYSDCVQM